jgi:hypothetical protein
MGPLFWASSLFRLKLRLVVAAQEGPNSLMARIIDHRSYLRGYGGLRGVGNEENLPLLSKYLTPRTRSINGG